MVCERQKVRNKSVKNTVLNTVICPIEGGNCHDTERKNERKGKYMFN